MDNGSGLDMEMRNWGCYGTYLKGNLGLQLMSAQPAERDTKSLLGGRDTSPFMINGNGGFHHRDCGVQVSLPMEPVRDSWMAQRDSWITQRENNNKHMSILPGNPNFGVLSESSGSHAFQMIPQPDFLKDERMLRMEEASSKSDVVLKKRAGVRAPKSPKMKKPKKAVAKDEANGSVSRAKPVKKNTRLVINGMDMDLSGLPSPVCSCTGAPQQCYRWGCGGWQSACCTTSISMYPLPMSTKRRGARIAGRKMSQGAFKKVLEKLAAEGYDFSHAIDLRTHWAKHGTNKFVTIR